MDQAVRKAPGKPGAPAHWTEGSKSGVGNAVNRASRVLFTLAKGIVTEVYYPREDNACIRQLGFLVADGKSFFSDESSDTWSSTRMVKDGVPLYKIKNRCRSNRYTLHKQVLVDPLRNVLLQQVQFDPASDDLALYICLYPHIDNQGDHNTAWIDTYKGTPMLFARHKNIALALACSEPWTDLSVGFEGASDGRKDLEEHKALRWHYNQAADGNVVLTGGIQCTPKKPFTLALGFASNPSAAAVAARASLMTGFETSAKQYRKEWKRWHGSVDKKLARKTGKHFRTSTMVLHMAESKGFPGGLVASFSFPWGSVRGDKDLGGYHVVWPRDLVESGRGLLALGATDTVLRMINYLFATENENGSWPQNMWLEGNAFMNHVQMDQVAFPIILIEQAYKKRLLSKKELKGYWPMVLKAIAFLAANGPYTQQDRWEQQPGIATFTLAVEIVGLVAAAALATALGHENISNYCLALADYWNSQVESWTYARDTTLAKQLGVEGYYVRINPHFKPMSEVQDELMHIPHHEDGEGAIKIGEEVCADPIALVRFGLRDAHDPRIENTIKVIDACLKVDTPYGPCWHRFVKDTYGEKDTGEPFTVPGKHGIGRAWPLLTGERAHYEIAAGHLKKARALLKTMDAFTDNGLLPEQVWDTCNIPQQGLYLGRPTGSAMPLVWAHAEYIKLCFSLYAREVLDIPPAVYKRYVRHKRPLSRAIWRSNWPAPFLTAAMDLRVEVMQPARIRWTGDGWQSWQDIETVDTGLGIYIADMPVGENMRSIAFTFYWPCNNTWEGKNYTITISETSSKYPRL